MANTIYPRKIRGGAAQVDVLNELFRYDEDTDRWIPVRKVTKSKAEKLKKKLKKERDTALFKSVPTVAVRTNRRTKRRYIVRRDDGLGSWR